MAQNNSIFELGSPGTSDSPLGNWMEQRQAQIEAAEVDRINRKSKAQLTNHSFEKVQSQYCTSTYFRDKDLNQYYLVQNYRSMRSREVNVDREEKLIRRGTWIPPTAKETKEIETKMVEEHSWTIAETAIFDMVGNLVRINEDGLVVPADGFDSYLYEKQENRKTVRTETSTRIVHTWGGGMRSKYGGNPETHKPDTEYDNSADYSRSDWVFDTFASILKNFDAANQGHITVHKDYKIHQANTAEQKLRKIGMVANLVPGLGRGLAGGMRVVAGLAAFARVHAPQDATEILLYKYYANPQKSHLKTWSYPRVDSDGTVSNNDKYGKVIGLDAAPKGLLTDPKYLKYADD